MDAETLKLIQRAVEEGITSVVWPALVFVVLCAGIAAFAGAYLKKKGEDVATRENFHEVRHYSAAVTYVVAVVIVASVGLSGYGYYVLTYQA